MPGADFCGCCNAPVACCLITYGGWTGLAFVQCENKKEMDGEYGCIEFFLTFFFPLRTSAFSTLICSLDVKLLPKVLYFKVPPSPHPPMLL